MDWQILTPYYWKATKDTLKIIFQTQGRLIFVLEVISWAIIAWSQTLIFDTSKTKTFKSNPIHGQKLTRKEQNASSKLQKWHYIQTQILRILYLVVLQRQIKQWEAYILSTKESYWDELGVGGRGVVIVKKSH